MIDIFKYESIEKYLIDIIDSKKSKNPNYSNRAFARDMGISVGMISSILNSKRHLGLSTAKKMGERLKLSNEELQYFVALARSDSDTYSVDKFKYTSYIRRHGTFHKRSIIEDEHLQFLNNWYSILIFSAFDYDVFNSNYAFLAKILDISVEEVIETLDNFVQLDLFKYNEGKYVKVVDAIEFKSDVPSEFIRKYHLSQLDKTKEMTVQSSIDERYLKNICFSFDVKHKEKIIQKIDDFVNEISALQKVGDPQSLVSVNISSLFFTSSQD